MDLSGGFFGQNKSSPFGSCQQSAFGTTTPSTVIWQWRSAPVRTTIKFNATRGKNSSRHICIIAMREYESKSLQILLEDYLASRGTDGGTSLVGTQQAARTFGATPGATRGGGLFGALSQNKPCFFSKVFRQSA